MTKADLVNAVSSRLGSDKLETQRVIEAFMSEAIQSLISGENLYLRGFGSFIVKKRAQKTGRNISKNKSIIIPAHNIPAFKPAKAFVNSVKKNVPVKS